MGSRALPYMVGFGWATALSVGALPALAFCRTTTCALPPTWDQSSACYPPMFQMGCPSTQRAVLPIWWRNACVGYDVQKNASKWVSYDAADRIVVDAFAKWTGFICPPDVAGETRVSITATDLGPVDCDRVEYSDQGNQHVIVFRDDAWPYVNDAVNTLGLTTITVDVETGEIYDADTEINGTMPLSVGDPVRPGAYDLKSIITHEMGHFLGLAHSTNRDATMYPVYSPETTSMRELAADDVKGICAIYPPGGMRAVAASVDASGHVSADTCDPTPRHGFAAQCALLPTTSASACGFAPTSGCAGSENRMAKRGPVPTAIFLIAAWLGLALARRRIASDPGASCGTALTRATQPEVRRHMTHPILRFAFNRRLRIMDRAVQRGSTTTQVGTVETLTTVPTWRSP